MSLILFTVFFGAVTAELPEQFSNDLVNAIIAHNTTDPVLPLPENKATRLQNAISALNLTSAQASLIASSLTAQNHDHVRRSIEDAVVHRLPFQFSNGFRFANPFFAAPLSSPALDQDYDRLLYVATPLLGPRNSFTLAKILHDINSNRSTVFELQERFSNMTVDAAKSLLAEYESVVLAPPSPFQVLSTTASLSGLNETESHRFARAIMDQSSPNDTQAKVFHNAIQNHAFNKSELMRMTEHIEHANQPSVTPPDAFGNEWLSDLLTNKRSIKPLTKMFSAERHCGFSIETLAGVVFPWNAHLSCGAATATGTLISESLILVTGSFIKSCADTPVQVILGINPFTKPFETNAVAAVVFPGFTPGGPNDVGVLKINPPVELDRKPYIFPICVTGVETIDPSVIFHVALVSPNQPVLTSQVQIGTHQTCGSSSCVQLNDCFPPQSQTSIPVIGSRDGLPRYFLWGVTQSSRIPSSCSYPVTKISDIIQFLITTLNS